MYRLSVLALLVLAGCVRHSGPAAGFRPASAPIYSNAVLENDRLLGRWVQVAEFADPSAPRCTFGGAEISRTPAGYALASRLCLNGKSTRYSGPMIVTGPGRFAVGGNAPWWIIWADVDYRTIVVGTPSGELGFILNRDGGLPADRMRAAREVLDFNGYDLRRLR